MRSSSFRVLVLLLVLAVTGCADRAEPTTAADPAPSTATPTSTPTPDPLSPELRALSATFLELARTGGPVGLPVAGREVRVLLGGDPASATTIPAADAGTAGPWRQLCDPDGAGYAERACPLDALQHVAPAGTELSPDPAQEPCSRPHGLEPADLGATQRITLLAPGARSCLDFAAVELYADATGRLVAADLVLGSP